MTHWKTILKELQEEKELLNLLQLEFHKLKRRKTVWLLMLSSIVMPFVALIYFSREVASGISAIQFYKWAVFSYTPWIILPVILGMLSTLIIYTENQNDVLKQLWIIPISKMKFFFSKFIVLFLFSMSFMLISAILSGSLGTAFGYFDFDWESSNFLFSKSLEIGSVISLAMMPVLAVALIQKGYILPVCVTLLYTFSGFLLLMVNPYLHPLSSAAALIVQNIPGVTLGQSLNISMAISCIGLWDIISVFLAYKILKLGK